MEVSPGYKQTELGIIPTEWNVSRLGDAAKFVTSGSRGWAQFYSESGALFIRSQNVRDGRLIFDDIQYVSPPSGAEGNRTKVELNDLLITITGNSVGNVALVDQTFAEAYISQHVGLVRLIEPNSGAYICHYLSPNSPGNSQIAGSQSGQSKPGLNLQNLRDFLIALPPTSDERRAIAEALNDVDGLLGGLDRLIAKKRDLKQAAMQQLLTGQTRLPGFHGEWEVKRFGQIAIPRRERIDPKRTGVPDFCIELEHIESGSGQILGNASTGTQSSLKSVFQPGDVLFGKLRAYLRKYWRATCDGVCSTEIWVLAPRGDGATSEFLFQIVQTEGFIEAASNSYGTHMPRSDWNAVQNYELKMPPVLEQTAIAEVLRDMDAELAALEQRREKTRALKQAMMQELLTGRARLV